MTDETELTKPEGGRKRAEREEAPGSIVKLGSWHWLRVDKHDNASKEGEREVLVCAVELGSNYVKVERPEGSTWRLHLDDVFPDVARPCANPQSVIRKAIETRQQNVSRLLDEVKEITARLGMAPTSPAEASSTALATLSGEADVSSYKTALIKAQKEDLPALFKKVAQEHKSLAVWMKAEMLPLEAVAHRAKDVIDDINGRIFNVEIYAGISEEATLVRDGKPASASEKLRVFQAMAYMDEECLLDYQSGGMDFKKIGAFDKWIAKPKNLERLIPFERCILAMQVRRKIKDRNGDPRYSGALGAFMRFDAEEFDKKTFLYVRNGEKLYRIDSKMEFGHLIFPSRNEFMAEPMVFKMDFSTPKFRTVREHEALVAEEAERKRLSAEWEAQNPFRHFGRTKLREEFLEWKKRRNEERSARRKARENRRGQTHVVECWSEDKRLADEIVDEAVQLHNEQARRPIKPFDPNGNARWEYNKLNPHHREFSSLYQDLDSWEPFDKSSVHFDEALETVEKRARHWNRVALVIQGLFDRSEILHPHPKVELWSGDGFAKAVELIYDGEHVLYDGEPPSFDDYRAKLNASLGEGSYTIGQQEIWLERERAREQRRRDGDWRLKYNEKDVSDWWTPTFDSGPGFLAKVISWAKRSRKATYRWTREPRRWSSSDKKIDASIQVSADALFNVSAYRLGDYLQFFRDPRTRTDYMKWAPMLLTAESWKARKYKKAEDVPTVTVKEEDFEPYVADPDAED